MPGRVKFAIGRCRKLAVRHVSIKKCVDSGLEATRTHNRVKAVVSNGLFS
jgi:hypothetical protein